MEERSFWFLRCSRSWQTTRRNSPGAKNQSLLPARAQPSCTDLSKFLCIRLHPREMGADKTNLSQGEDLLNSLILLEAGVSPGLRTETKVTPGELLCGRWANTCPAPTVSSFCHWHQWGQDFKVLYQLQIKKDVKMGTVMFIGHHPLLWGLRDMIPPVTCGFAQPRCSSRKDLSVKMSEIRFPVGVAH